MKQPNEPAHWWVITRAILWWGFVGLLISSVMCYVEPRRYASQATLEANETAGRSVRLSPLHAAQATCLAWYTNNESAPDASVIEDVCKHTYIRASEGIVKIEVRNTDKVFARDLALELASIFRSMDEEEALAKVPTNLPQLAESDKLLFDERKQLIQLMNEDAEAAVGIRSFRAIQAMAKKGQPEATTLWESENFQRQSSHLNTISEKLIPGSASLLPTLPLAGLPIIADRVASPNVDLYLRCGLLIGLAFGSYRGARRVRKIAYSTGKTEQSVESLTPAYDRSPAESNQKLAVKPPPSTPEEEW